MTKLLNSCCIALVFLLTSCNAFKQKVTLGPGTGEFKDHTFEILIMLAGAFALGLWLGWILWNRFKQMVENLRMENESLTATVGSLRTEVDTLKSRLSLAETEKNDLSSQIGSLTWENSDYKSKFVSLQNDFTDLMERNRTLEIDLGSALAISPESAQIPMEIVSTPIDLHVEDLAAPIEVEEPIVIETIAEPIVEALEAPIEIEPITIEAEPIIETILPAIETIAEAHIEIPEVEIETPAAVTVELPIDPIVLPEIEHVVIVEAPIEVLHEPLPILETTVVSALVADDLVSPVLEMPEIAVPVIEVPEIETPEIVYETVVPPHIEETIVIHEPLAAVETVVEAPEVEAIHVETPALVEESHTISMTSSLIEPEVVEVIAPTIEEPVMTFTDISTPLVAPAVLVDRRDDLKIVEGIGPKIEELLFKNGINTYTQLAATPVNRVKEILISSGPSYAMHDPGTWPAQALLAANGEWENLRAYQSFLNAGKRPS